MHIIYKHTNKINGKAYIGFTPKTAPKLEKPLSEMIQEDITTLANKLMIMRLKSHYYHASRDSQLLFHRAIRKYSNDAFKHEILEICDSLEKVLKKEIFWIKKLKTHVSEHGYNMTHGGERGFTTLKSKELCRLASKRMWEQPEFRKKCIENMKLAANKPELKAKLRTTRLKPVQQLDIVTKQLIANFESIIDASATTNINKDSIGKAARGERRSAGGYDWKFTTKLDQITSLPTKTHSPSKELEIILNKKYWTHWEQKIHTQQIEALVERSRIRCSKIVQQIDIKTKIIIATYNSVAEAYKITKIRHISSCARGEHNHAGGFIWRYVPKDNPVDVTLDDTSSNPDASDPTT